jgi:hypothetical protein
MLNALLPELNATALISARPKPRDQKRGGLNPIRAHRSSNCICKLRTDVAAVNPIIKFVAWGNRKFKEILFWFYIKRPACLVLPYAFPRHRRT